MHDMQHEHAREMPAFHGMVLFGEQAAYLSHLPMFMVPHFYQAIFEVTLSKEGTDPLAGYLEDRRTHPEARMYSFRPIIDPRDEDPLTDLFVLTDLITPANPHDPNSPPIRSSFKGDIIRGHFETFHEHEKAESDPAEPIPGLEGVTANVTNAFVFRKFDVHQELPQLEYFLFGNPQELFLAHVITHPPDFDHVLSVRIDGHEFTDDELRRGLLVTFPGRENSARRRLKEQDEVAGQVQVPAQRSDGPHSVEVQIGTGIQYYFETDDLASQM